MTDPLPPNGDRLSIRLRPRCRVGCYPWEKDLRREVLVEITLWTDCRRAAATDKVEHALDYEPLGKAVLAFAEGHHYNLVETLAEGMVRICVVDHGVERARVKVTKTELLPGMDAVAVEIERSAADYDA